VWSGQVESVQLSLELTWSELEAVTRERDQLVALLDSERQINRQLRVKVRSSSSVVRRKRNLT